nr:hypothetical protein [uncultured Friedmanniella sp.]
MASTPAADVSPAPKRRRPWWVLFAIFVAGLVFGVLLVGLLSAGTPDFVVANREAAASASPSPSASVEVAAQARVNAACLRVINDAQDVYSALAGLGEAVDDVDFGAMDDVVRRLQPVEPRLARDLQACEVIVEAGSAGTPGPDNPSSSAIVPTPSASATS